MEMRLLFLWVDCVTLPHVTSEINSNKVWHKGWKGNVTAKKSF